MVGVCVCARAREVGIAGADEDLHMDGGSSTLSPRLKEKPPVPSSSQYHLGCFRKLSFIRTDVESRILIHIGQPDQKLARVEEVVLKVLKRTKEEKIHGEKAPSSRHGQTGS